MKFDNIFLTQGGGGGSSESLVRVYKVALFYYASCVCGRMWHISVYYVRRGKRKGADGTKGEGTKGVKGMGGGRGSWKRVSPRPPLGVLAFIVLSASSETSHNLMTFSAFFVEF